MSWVIEVPNFYTPRQIPMEPFIFDVLVEFEGRLVVLVTGNVSGGSRVISIVVRTESHEGL